MNRDSVVRQLKSEIQVQLEDLKANMEPTPVDAAFSPWQSFYQTLTSSSFIGTVMSTKPLLAGWWQFYPQLMNIFIGSSSLQIGISTLGLIFILIQVYQRKHSLTVVYDDYRTDQSIRTIILIKPIVTLLWQISIGFIGVTLAKTWISSATATFIYLHSWFEFTSFLLTVILAIHTPLYTSTLFKLKYSLLLVSGLITVIFMCSGDVYWKAALGGISLIADLGNFFTAPISFLLLSKRTWWTRGLSRVEGLSLALYVNHVINFYPEALVAVYASDGVYKAGILLSTFTTLNLALLIGYITVSIFTFNTISADQLPFHIRP